MSLIPQDLAAIDALLSAPPGDGKAETLIAALREKLPGLVYMRCDASDVLEEPWRSYSAINLYLIDASDHCVAVTDDAMRAGGLLLAERLPI